jgi:hypothetical protein
MDFDLSGRSEAWREKLQAFFDAEVLLRPKSSIVRRPTSPTRSRCRIARRQSRRRAGCLRQIFRTEPMPSWSIANSPYLAAHPS